MKGMKLTRSAGAATQFAKVSEGGAGAMKGQIGWRWRALTLAVPLVLGGCINLTAPTEPIVIELNINITQEVIYRLAEDASDAIDENADIF
ncbi:MAG: YnbE family lipoprotein [Marinomonas sp.]